MTKKGSKKITKTTEAKNDEAPAPKKGKQLGLPGDGMQRKKIAELDKQAEKYRAARDVRMEHTKTEKAEKTVLVELVKKHGIESYVYEDEDGEEFVVEYKAATKENVKVRKVDHSEDE